jgi:hypothetical protein
LGSTLVAVLTIRVSRLLRPASLKFVTPGG